MDEPDGYLKYSINTVFPSGDNCAVSILEPAGKSLGVFIGTFF